MHIRSLAVFVAALTTLSCISDDEKEPTSSNTDAVAPTSDAAPDGPRMLPDGFIPPPDEDAAPTPTEDSTPPAPMEPDSAAPPRLDASMDPVEDAAPSPVVDAAPRPIGPLPPGCVIVGEGCDPNPPHNDPVGQICANDGQDDEAYCTYDRQGRMVCAHMEGGGQCESAPPPDGPGPDPDPEPVPDGPGDLMISALEMDDPLSRFFARQITVFGIRVVATAQVPAAKVTHAAHIMAEYLDNDEDGQVDDPPVVQAMIRRRALLVMFASSNELENSGIFEGNVIDGFHAQDLQGDETNVPGRFDAALEEVLHLISTAGYEQVYPQALGSRAGTLLANAMDQARGGRFERIPNPYPEGAWYHYDDRTCDYRCMAVEYFYWALTTLLGAQNDPARCREISREWELCTAEQLRDGDPAVHTLLTDPAYNLPTRLPDGRYTP